MPSQETPVGRSPRSAERAVDELEAGTPIGSFLIAERRSCGGFADVYRATHVSLDRQVAIKVLHTRWSCSESMLARFEQEANTLSRLRHPHIVDVFDVGDLPDGRPYIVMEWLDGRNLSEELSVRGPLPPPHALIVMEEIGSALSAAHELGVIHRDLKAANIIAVPVGDGFFVKLLDFGIAKLQRTLSTSSHCTVTTAGTRLGTPESMSPEQILGQPLDARADVYGLGVLLYQMVTGELPFRAGTTVDVEELHLRGDRPRASELAPVTSAFDAVVRRALEPERSARYQTVRELLANLRRAIATVEDPVVERFETIGVRLEVKIAQDYASPHTNNGLDAMIDDVDQVSGLVRQQLLHQGLALTLDGTNVVLGVLRLPPGPEAARQVRRRTIDQVRCLAEMIANRPAAHPAVAPVLSVHVSAVAARLGADRPEDVAGPLLDVTRWPPMSNVGGVCVSPQALADIEEGSAAG